LVIRIKIKVMKIELIAEIGWNHMGDMDLAKEMIKAAHDSGADYAKFQTWSVNRLKPGEWDEDGRRQIYEKAELSKEDHQLLIDYCDEVGIKFMSSVFSIPDAQLLVDLGIKEVKIPSFESRNKELIDFCDEHFDRIFMSTGTSTLKEIRKSMQGVKEEKFTLMHCVSTYPCGYEHANIPKMFDLKYDFPYCDLGYSDHIEGIESAKIAIMFGARVIEKHFTTDKSLPGRDNKFAITPDEMLGLSKYISYINDMLKERDEVQEAELGSRENYTGRFNG